MRNFVTIAGAAALLTACGGTDVDADGDGTITQNEVEAAVAAVELEPGQWENTVKTVDVEFDESRLPPEAKEMMVPIFEGMKGQTNTTTNCVTPEEASKPQADIFSGNAGQDCTYDTFEFSGGKVNMAMTCSEAGAGTAKITNTGTYTPSEYDMDMKIEVQDETMGTLTITANSTGKRIGECTAGQAG